MSFIRFLFVFLLSLKTSFAIVKLPSELDEGLIKSVHSPLLKAQLEHELFYIQKVEFPYYQEIHNNSFAQKLYNQETSNLVQPQIDQLPSRISPHNGHLNNWYMDTHYQKFFLGGYQFSFEAQRLLGDSVSLNFQVINQELDSSGAWEYAASAHQPYTSTLKRDSSTIPFTGYNLSSSKISYRPQINWKSPIGHLNLQAFWHSQELIMPSPTLDTAELYRLDSKTLTTIPFSQDLSSYELNWNNQNLFLNPSVAITQNNFSKSSPFGSNSVSGQNLNFSLLHHFKNESFKSKWQFNCDISQDFANGAVFSPQGRSISSLDSLNSSVLQDSTLASQRWKDQALCKVSPSVKLLANTFLNSSIGFQRNSSFHNLQNQDWVGHSRIKWENQAIKIASSLEKSIKAPSTNQDLWGDAMLYNISNASLKPSTLFKQESKASFALPKLKQTYFFSQNWSYETLAFQRGKDRFSNQDTTSAFQWINLNNREQAYASLGVKQELGNWAVELHYWKSLLAQKVESGKLMDDPRAASQLWKGSIFWERRLLSSQNLAIHTRVNWNVIEERKMATYTDNKIIFHTYPAVTYLDLETRIRVGEFELYGSIRNLNHEITTWQPGYLSPGLHFLWGVRWVFH